MRWIYFAISLVVTIIFVYYLSIPLPPASFPLGSFVSPFHGFWQNAAADSAEQPLSIESPYLDSSVEVIFDRRNVPHIFAQTEKDLAFVQGYVTARDRLWQMEFQVLAASGRLVEILPQSLKKRVLPIDKAKRRKGIVYAAERSLEGFMEDTQSRTWLEAYTEGVNTYINELADRDLPLEYKLLNYRPELWSPLKSCLFLKFMAEMLSYGLYNQDIPYTKALHTFGRDTFDLFYPEVAFPEEPIIPSAIQPDFTPATIPRAPRTYSPDTINFLTRHIDHEAPTIGSNNWAVAGIKTKSGAPILANDPHLKLGLPAIWYEIQLSAPGINVYGVSLPGTPAVIIGFNDSIAWGSTNAGRDVVDYYKLDFRDENRKEYKYKGEWVEVEPRVEVFQISNDEVVYDTVDYTIMGPIIYDQDDTLKEVPFTMRWTAYETSNELQTFIKLAKANNYQDFTNALESFKCPAQNLVFASVQGDIALWQQGLFVNRWNEQGRFILNASDSTHLWQSFIPQEHNPHTLNPARGFVSSTNQHPTDNQYPYYYTGYFEAYRNRRINRLLREGDSMTVEDMFSFQLDNYGVLAEDILPLLLSELDSSRLSAIGMAARDTLLNWNYVYQPNYTAPTIFTQWWKNLRSDIWTDDIQNGLPLPGGPATVQLLKNQPDLRFYDDIRTSMKESRADIIQRSFMDTLDSLQRYASSTADWQWHAFKATTIPHLAQLKPFGTDVLYVGGDKSILNAIGKGDGPSWRMVVSLERPVKAFGVYPGAQTGNPGHPEFTDFIDEWENGTYFNLWLMDSPMDRKNPIRQTIQFTRTNY